MRVTKGTRLKTSDMLVLGSMVVTPTRRLPVVSIDIYSKYIPVLFKEDSN